MRWLVEIIRDQPENIRDGLGNIIERKIIGRTSAKHSPYTGEFQFLNGAEKPKFPTLVNVDGDWEVHEDILKLEFENDIEQRSNRQIYGKRILAMVGRMNDSKNLSNGQTQQMRLDFKLIREALHDGDILAAEELIAAIIPDENVVKAAEKAFLVNEIANNKAKLGYE